MAVARLVNFKIQTLVWEAISYCLKKIPYDTSTLPKADNLLQSFAYSRSVMGCDFSLFNKSSYFCDRDDRQTGLLGVGYPKAPTQKEFTNAAFHLV